MPGYMYRAIGPDGKEKKGNITATNQEQAASKLKADGLIVMKIEPQSALNKEITLGGSGVKTRDYAVFCRPCWHGPSKFRLIRLFYGMFYEKIYKFV